MRLIDADALVEKMESDAEHMDNMTFKLATYAAINDINHQPTIDPQKWIPVSERLPKYEMDVLLQFTSNMCIGFFHPSESWIIWSGGDWCTGVLEGDEEPIAWMPLPEPWGGDSDE